MLRRSRGGGWKRAHASEHVVACKAVWGEPPHATMLVASRMPLLTARSTARSVGSGSFAKTWVVTMSLRRPGIATRIATLACWVEVMVDDGAVVRVVVCVSRKTARVLCFLRGEPGTLD